MTTLRHIFEKTAQAAAMLTPAEQQFQEEITDGLILAIVSASVPLDSDIEAFDSDQHDALEAVLETYKAAQMAIVELLEESNEFD